MPKLRKKFFSNNLNLNLKKLKKRRANKPKSSRRKEIVKSTAEMNEIETRETIEKI